MGKVLKSDDILRMVYRAYKGMLKESSGNGDESYSEPVDFHPSFYKNKFYFNITFKDKSVFPQIANFGNMMAGMAMRSAEKRNIPFTEDDFARVRNMFRIASSNKRLDKNTEWIIIKVEISKPEELLDENGNPNFNSQDIKKIVNMFTGLKRVGIDISDEDKKNAFQTMFYYVANRPTKESEEMVDEETKKLFFRICQTIGDEETRKLLRTIQITDEGFIADHQISLKNKLRVISQAIIYDKDGGNQVNTISYLATPRQWREMGRRVVDFSHPYYLITFNGGRGSQDREVTFAKERGMSPLMVNENSSNGIGFNAGRGLNAFANRYMYNGKSFTYNDAEYDVSATQKIEGAKDRFTEEPGMKNNLTGELNDVAISKMYGQGYNSNNDEKAERTERLNKIFGTGDYSGIDLTYKAVCYVSGVEPSLDGTENKEKMIKETGYMIDKMLINKLSGFKDGEGRIAKPENYLPLVPVGRIIIQAIIGLPMDDAPAIAWAREHQQIANALSSHVNSISNKILDAKKRIGNEKK